MITTYRRVLSLPGAALMSLTGVIARAPISMMTLGIVLLVSSATGSYGLAGAVSAAFVIGNAIVAIPHGRLADRFGQRIVLLLDSLVFAVAVALLIRAVTDGWDTPWPHVFAAVAGVAQPQIGSLVRARWAHLLDGDADLHTAFALEAIGDEVVFVAGPTVVTFIATLWAPQAGLIVAVVLGTLGSLALAAQRDTEPPAHTTTTARSRGTMPWRRLITVTIGAGAIGSLFGAMEVATVAVADHSGKPAAAGLILTALALGSLLAGFLAGAHTFTMGYIQRARVGVVALTVGFVVLPFVTSLWLLGGLMFLVGFGVAPTMIAVISYVEELAPKARLTEAMGLLQAGMAAGIAPGTWGAGHIADLHGASAAFWMCVAGGVVATIAAFATD